MATQRPHPLGEVVSLHAAMSHLMEESFFRAHSLRHHSGVLDVPIDLYDAGDTYVLRAAIPGAQAQNVQVTILGNTLRIEGQIAMHQADPQQEVSWLVHEIPHGSFLRSVTLPQRADPDKATASFEAGILTLWLPKAEQSRSRQIKITPGAP